MNAMIAMTVTKKYWPLPALWFMIALIALLSLSACEDLIEMDLAPSQPQIIIVGEINNEDFIHKVNIHKTVDITAESLHNPVSGAKVTLKNERKQEYTFVESEIPGEYLLRGFQGKPRQSYQLEVEVEGMVYTATSEMPVYVGIDSIGTITNDFFGSDNRFISVKFTDPPQLRNFYLYRISINNGPFRFISVFEDKFNNGRAVSHELIHPDLLLKAGDKVVVQRQTIDQQIFTYWNAIGFSNPAASTPANPVSNFSNGALGYFSAYSKTEYFVEVTDYNRAKE